MVPEQPDAPRGRPPVKAARTREGRWPIEPTSLAGRAIRWIPAVIEATLLFLLSSRPDLTFAQDPLLDLVVRKVGHAVAYGVLAVLVAWARNRGPDEERSVVLLLVAVYAITDEIHQSFVPGRSGAITDVLVDTAGAVAGLGLRALAARRRSPCRR